MAPVVVSLMLLSSSARAETTTVSVGLAMAGGFAPRIVEGGVESGFALGTEASIVHVFSVSGGYFQSPDWWLGGFVSGIRDFDSRLSRASTGVRFGYGFVGLDVGPVMQVAGGAASGGITSRALINMFFLMPYASVGVLPASEERRWFGELGVTLLLPFDAKKRRVLR